MGSDSFCECLMKRKVTFSEKPPSETYIIEEVFFTDVKYPEEQKHYKCVSKVFVIQKEFPFLICYSNINYTVLCTHVHSFSFHFSLFQKYLNSRKEIIRTIYIFISVRINFNK